MSVASVPQLHRCQTNAASIDELVVEIREAIQLYLEAEGSERRTLEAIVATVNTASPGSVAELEIPILWSVAFRMIAVEDVTLAA
jgi:predicted RNase H-like HicB family nuclease